MANVVMQLIMTVAVEIEVDEDFDIDELYIDEISFTNPEVERVLYSSCEIVENFNAYEGDEENNEVDNDDNIN
jgi:hypothetical protein